MDPVSRRDFLQQSTALALAAGTLAASGKASAQEQTTATLTTGTATQAAPRPSGEFVVKTAIKTSILKRVAGENASWEEKLTLAKEVGFEGVEWDDITTPDEGTEMQRMATEMGVPCHGVVFGGWHAPLSDPDEEVQKRGLDGMRNAIEAAAAMKVETCLLVPANVQANVQYDEAYRRSQDNVRKLIPHAEKHNVIICLENVWNRFLLSPMEFARYIDEIDSPHVRMYFDVSNSLVQGFSEHWMRILGPERIRKIDVKDFSRKDHRFVPIGNGDVDFPEITKILKEWGYNDFLTSETGVTTKEDLEDSRRRLQRVFGAESA